MICSHKANTAAPSPSAVAAKACSSRASETPPGQESKNADMNSPLGHELKATAPSPGRTPKQNDSAAAQSRNEHHSEQTPLKPPHQAPAIHRLITRAIEQLPGCLIGPQGFPFTPCALITRIFFHRNRYPKTLKKPAMWAC